MFCESKQIKELVELKKEKVISHLDNLILIDVGDFKDVKLAEEAGLHVY